MEIEPEILDLDMLWEVEPTVAELVEKKVPKFMTYPKGGKEIPFVIQTHRIGESQHVDFRFKLNGFLNGWTIVGGTTSDGLIKDEITPKKLLDNIGKGFRAEEKAVQPPVWMSVDTPHVDIAGEPRGQMWIMTTGKAILGTQKPYFHEYFLLSESKDRSFPNEITGKSRDSAPRESVFGGFKEWTRIVIRGVSVSRID